MSINLGELLENVPDASPGGIRSCICKLMAVFRSLSEWLSLAFPVCHDSALAQLPLAMSSLMFYLVSDLLSCPSGDPPSFKSQPSSVPSLSKSRRARVVFLLAHAILHYLLCDSMPRGDHSEIFVHFLFLHFGQNL